MLKVLVTDGANKNALSILRHLGSECRIDMTTHLPKRLSLCSYSKYCGKIIKLNENPQDIDSYARELIQIIENGDYDVFIPVGLNSNLMASKYKSEIQSRVKSLIPDWKYMMIAANKDKTMEHAANLGVPIPKTLVLNNPEDLKNIDIFPVVVKSSDESKNYIKYCNNSRDLFENYNQLRSKSKTKIICQEYIEGYGCGFFGIYHEGKLISHFLHKRLKEFPITGGPSAVAESFFDENLYHYGKLLCDSLNWNGPIMAEFKYDIVEGDYKLIELNPKLWGSLDLTIEAGINVPKILIQTALNKELDNTSKYQYIKYRWVFPDEFKVLISDPSLRAFKDFASRESGTLTNICFSDPMPTIFQIVRSVVEGLSITIDSKKRYPHGRQISNSGVT